MEVNRYRLRVSKYHALVIASCMTLTLLCAGCLTQEVTSPPRSATEQLLLSTAADRAMAGVNLNIFSGQMVYLDFTYFEGYDSKYAEGEIRDALSRAGALLTTSATNADVIIEPRAGAYSAETNSTFFGLPSIPLPVPSTSEIPIIPQIALYEKNKQISYAKIALLAYANQTRAHIYSSGPLDGQAYNTYRSVFFISWWRSDIPEKVKKKYQDKYQVWTPQYDRENMPPLNEKSPDHPVGTNAATISTDAP
jgi:hypothetical protein